MNVTEKSPLAVVSKSFPDMHIRVLNVVLAILITSKCSANNHIVPQLFFKCLLYSFSS